ncbi:MAG: nucleotidyl transferase AbiEii/AbiGii toxin family protein [Pyrinomonadaceae bacterium]
MKSDSEPDDEEYEGVRLHVTALLDQVRINLQVDVGFADRVVPAPEMIDFPTLLDFPAPHIRSYTRESAIAEKFEAMVKLGMLNSRMKDFYYLWTLSRVFSFDGPTLSKEFSVRIHSCDGGVENGCGIGRRLQGNRN